jgi:hypothetical protein
MKTRWSTTRLGLEPLEDRLALAVAVRDEKGLDLPRRTPCRCQGKALLYRISGVGGGSFSLMR